MTLDEKWELAKPYYERAYHLQFRHRPSDEKILFLYEQMRLLTETMQKILDDGRPKLIRYLDGRSGWARTKEKPSRAPSPN